LFLRKERRGSMSAFSPGRLSPIARATIGFVLLILVAGCDDEQTNPTCASLIFGKVSGPSGHLQADVLVESWSRSAFDVNFLGSVKTDAAGRYEVSVPRGDYRIRARIHGSAGRMADVYYAHGSPVLDRRDADTVRIGDTPRNIPADFEFGSLAVEMRTPDYLEREILAVNVYVPGPITEFGEAVRFLASESLLVENGIAVYRFDAVPAGDYHLALGLSSGESVILPGTRSFLGSAVYKVGRGEATAIQAIVPGFGSIKGRVRCALTDVDLSRFAVRLCENESSPICSTPVDRQGNFMLRIHAPVRGYLSLQGPDVNRWYGAGPRFFEAAELELQPGYISPDANFTIRGVVGRIVGPGSTSIGPMTVRIIDAVGRPAAELSAEADGSFRALSLGRGRHYLWVAPAERGSIYLPQWYDRGGSLDDATPIEIMEDGPIPDVAVQLVEGGRIRGSVADTWGNGISTTLVRLTSAQNQFPLQFETTTQEGAFVLVGLPDGDYKVGAIGLWYPQTAAWDSAAVISVHNHEEIDGIVIRAHAPAGKGGRP
jgi:hypothetical protein